jgi:hypothetical protein
MSSKRVRPDLWNFYKKLARSEDETVIWAELNKDIRDLWQRRHEERMTVAGIAEFFGISQASVRQALAAPKQAPAEKPPQPAVSAA